MVEINAKGLGFRELNEKIRAAASSGEKDIKVKGVNGQYYIGDGLRGNSTISIEGVPGNDLAAFMDGPTIVISGNAQDNIGNTMNSGKVVVRGNAGDVLGYGMRGGKIHVLGDVGYRVAIHMKGLKKQAPTIVVGGKAGDFFGEYMAGGVLILLGLNEKDGAMLAGDYLGTGMHGGAIYVRGDVDKDLCGAEVGIAEPDAEDMATIKEAVGDFCKDFGLKPEDVMSKPFKKLYPASLRPYGNLYAY